LAGLQKNRKIFIVWHNGNRRKNIAAPLSYNRCGYADTLIRKNRTKGKFLEEKGRVYDGRFFIEN
jgi:hypothetical protein